MNVLSQWLARHVGDAELRTELDGADLATLGPNERDALVELRTELEHPNGGGELEMLVRETLEALALGS